MRFKTNRGILPGFGLSMGYTMFYLSILVLIPLSMIVVRSFELNFSDFSKTVFSTRALAAYRLSLTAALCAAVINAVFGLLIAWVLVRYRFPMRRILDGLVDLPFALPTAVAGIALTSLYSDKGLIGSILNVLGLKVAYAFPGIVVALTFIGLPFVVRTVQPVLQNMEREVEEAAWSLGATKRCTFMRIILAEIFPALLTGFTLAFARALGEYGSVIFIAGNMPLKTEITPLLIMIKLEQFDYEGATALALVFLIISFMLILAINVLQRRCQALKAQV